MGIDAEGVQFLGVARRLGVDFSRTVTIGRQSLRVAGSEAVGILETLGVETAGAVDGPWADGLFRSLGAATVDSIDTSDYESASILHDMNDPLPVEHEHRYSCVIDGGAVEHVFDVAQALRNDMALVADGGWLIFITPANNQVGHGFYQLSPELFFRALDGDNGFRVMTMLLHDRGVRDRWIHISDPAVVGRRVTFSTAGEANLYVLAQRTATATSTSHPMQSDYSSAWSGGQPSAPSSRQRGRQKIHALVGARLGRVLRAARTMVGSAGRGTPGTEKCELRSIVSDFSDQRG